MIRTWLLLVVAGLGVLAYDIVSEDLTENSIIQEELVTLGTGDNNPKAEEITERPRASRRTALSLPDNTSCKISFDLSMSVNPLNNTYTSLTLSLPFRFVLPTYKQLNNLYGNLDRLDNDLSDNQGSREGRNGRLIDYEFLEQQIANEQRRSIYQHIELMLEKLGFNGELCLQRIICELAEAPLGHHGLIGKLLHALFSPSLVRVPEMVSKFLDAHGNSNRVRRDSSLLPELELLGKPVDDHYTEAHRTGREKKCWARYSSCPFSIFTLLRV